MTGLLKSQSQRCVDINASLTARLDDIPQQICRHLGPALQQASPDCGEAQSSRSRIEEVLRNNTTELLVVKDALLQIYRRWDCATREDNSKDDLVPYKNTFAEARGHLEQL